MKRKSLKCWVVLIGYANPYIDLHSCSLKGDGTFFAFRLHVYYTQREAIAIRDNLLKQGHEQIFVKKFVEVQ